jgi:hypothetical protein
VVGPGLTPDELADGSAVRAGHWDAVYGRSDESTVSWFEPEPAMSLELLDLVGADADDAVIDVGAGASLLVDALLARRFTDVTLLDVSEVGLAQARRRLGEAARRVQWLVSDLVSWRPARRYRIWHDRAVFHFLTEPADQARYRELLDAALVPGAGAVVGTFAADGPDQCSGLPTARYSPETLAAALGSSIEPLASRREIHRTPWGAIQPFTWLAGRRR